MQYFENPPRFFQKILKADSLINYPDVSSRTHADVHAEIDLQKLFMEFFWIFFREFFHVILRKFFNKFLSKFTFRFCFSNILRVVRLIFSEFLLEVLPENCLGNACTSSSGNSSRWFRSFLKCSFNSFASDFFRTLFQEFLLKFLKKFLPMFLLQLI